MEVVQFPYAVGECCPVSTIEPLIHYQADLMMAYFSPKVIKEAKDAVVLCLSSIFL